MGLLRTARQFFKLLSTVAVLEILLSSWKLAYMSIVKSFAAQVLANALHVGGIGHAPYAPAGGIDDDVGGRFAEGGEEGFTLFFATTRETAAIDLGNELEGLDGVGGGGAAFVPLFFNGLLEAGDAGGVEVVLRLGGGDGDVVNEHGKLAHAEGVHALVFVHDVGDDGGTVEEVVARMDGPNEVDLGFV